MYICGSKIQFSNYLVQLSDQVQRITHQYFNQSTAHCTALCMYNLHHSYAQLQPNPLKGLFPSGSFWNSSNMQFSNYLVQLSDKVQMIACQYFHHSMAWFLMGGVQFYTFTFLMIFLKCPLFNDTLYFTIHIK